VVRGGMVAGGVNFKHLIESRRPVGRTIQYYYLLAAGVLVFHVILTADYV